MIIKSALDSCSRSGVCRAVLFSVEMEMGTLLTI